MRLEGTIVFGLLPHLMYGNVSWAGLYDPMWKLAGIFHWYKAIGDDYFLKADPYTEIQQLIKDFGKKIDKDHNFKGTICNIDPIK